MDFAEGTGATQGYASPVPNFLSAQMAAKALTAQAVLASRSGDTDRAVHLYKTSLIMGRDYQSEGTLLISNLIGYAIQQLTVKSLGRDIQAGRFNQKQLGELRNTLIRAEHNRGTIAEIARLEFEASYQSFQEMETELKTNPDELLAQINETLQGNGVAPLSEAPDLETIKGLMKNVEEQRIQALEGSYSERVYIVPEMPENLTGFEQLFFKMMTNNRPDYKEASTREATMLANLRMAQLACAVSIFKLETGFPPKALQEVAPMFGGTVPTDPFNDQPFSYSVVNERDWKLWSVGPDGLSDNGEKQYSPVNGTLSEGDIVFPMQ